MVLLPLRYFIFSWSLITIISITAVIAGRKNDRKEPQRVGKGRSLSIVDIMMLI